MNVFETILIVNGRPVELQAHVKRLKKSIGIDATGYIEKAIPNSATFGRLRIDGNENEIVSATYTQIAMPLLFQNKMERIHVKIIRPIEPYRSKGFGNQKNADRNYFDKIETALHPAVPLFIDDQDNILESSRHNYFSLRNNVLTTPPLDGRILPGIARHRILALAQKLGVRTEERPVSKLTVFEADAVFVSNSIVGFVVAEKIDTQKWSDAPALLYDLQQKLASVWLAN